MDKGEIKPSRIQLDEKDNGDNGNAGNAATGRGPVRRRGRPAKSKGTKKNDTASQPWLINSDNLTLEDVKCAICYEIFLEPVTYPCLHSCCLACHMEHVAKCNLQCPICRLRLSVWNRKASQTRKFVNTQFWEKIQNKFAAQVAARQNGDTSTLPPSPVKTGMRDGCTAAPGDILKDFERDAKNHREELERERKIEEDASLELITALIEQEGLPPGYRTAQDLNDDQALAQRLQAEYDNESAFAPVLPERVQTPTMGPRSGMPPVSQQRRNGAKVTTPVPMKNQRKLDFTRMTPRAAPSASLGSLEQLQQLKARSEVRLLIPPIPIAAASSAPIAAVPSSSIAALPSSSIADVPSTQIVPTLSSTMPHVPSRSFPAHVPKRASSASFAITGLAPVSPETATAEDVTMPLFSPTTVTSTPAEILAADLKFARKLAAEEKAEAKRKWLEDRGPIVTRRLAKNASVSGSKVVANKRRHDTTTMQRSSSSQKRSRIAATAPKGTQGVLDTFVVNLGFGTLPSRSSTLDRIDAEMEHIFRPTPGSPKSPPKRNSDRSPPLHLVNVQGKTDSKNLSNAFATSTTASEKGTVEEGDRK